ncbi:MAG: hypothetical protein JWQ76_882 [Ramlibacter sp.]|nr:hypothetical protein [Ramlibacter sp.]
MQITRRELTRAMACLPLALAGTSRAQASFPSRAVRIILPFAPGGAGDMVARVLAERLTDLWKQPVIIENKAGASGIVATQAVQVAPPDGYVVTLASFQHAVNPFLVAKLPYDSLKDFTPISQVSNTQLILVANPSLPVRNVRELIAYAKQNPGKLNYASAGNGSSTQLAAALLSSMAGIEMVQVAYKGSGPALLGMMSNEANLGFDGLISALPQIRAGKLKALAMAGSKRSPQLPDVPTVAESGVPGFDTGSWLGIIGPANMPADVVNKWQHDVASVLAQPAVRDRYLEGGIDPVGSTPAEFTRFLQSEMTRWADVIAKAGIKPT